MKVSLYLIFALIFSFFTANVNATKFPSFNKHDMPAVSAQVDSVLIKLQQQQQQQFDENASRELLRAVLANNPWWVDEVLKTKKPNVDITDEQGRTPLMISTRKGNHIEMMHSLIKANANVFLKDKDGRTALIHAARNDNAEGVLYLCRAKSEMEVEDNFGWTPALYATSNNNIPMINTLIEYKAEFTPRLPGKDAPLFVAIANNNKDVFITLVGEAQANIFYKGPNGMTILMFAAYKNSYQLIIPILNFDVAIDERNKSDHLRTALMYAAAMGSMESVRILLDRGADRTLTDDGDNTALDYAVDNGHTDIAAVLRMP